MTDIVWSVIVAVTAVGIIIAVYRNIKKRNDRWK